MRAVLVCACIGVVAVTVIGVEFGCQPRVTVGGGDKIKPGDAEAAWNDPWVHRLQGSGDPLEVNPAANSYVVHFDVALDKQAEAVAMLEAHSWVELSRDTAHELLGHTPSFDPRKEKIVLLRCAQVRPTEPRVEEKSKVSVEWNAGSVHVVSSALRESYAPVDHVAIVAVLPALPERVFVDMFTAIY